MRRKEQRVVIAEVPRLGPMPEQARSIILEIAALRGVDVSKIISRCRVARIYRARVEISKLLAARGYSTSRIGRFLNHDHTTIVFYLGNAKKKPSPLKWRTPKVRHLRFVRPVKPATSAKKRKKPKLYLQPYAGADMTDYVWTPRPQQEQRA